MLIMMLVVVFFLFTFSHWTGRIEIYNRSKNTNNRLAWLLSDTLLVNLVNRVSTTQSDVEQIITMSQFIQDLYKFRCKYHIKDLDNADVKNNNGVVIVNDMLFERVFIQPWNSFMGTVINELK